MFNNIFYSNHIENDNKVYGNVVFGGNNFIFCMSSNSKRLFGGDRPSRLIMAFLLINIPPILFYIYVNHITYAYYKSSLPTLFAAILQFLTTIMMLITGLSDPGIIPKNFFDKKALN
jgi:hypothetical protein